jgi:hypothetical protein
MRALFAEGRTRGRASVNRDVRTSSVVAFADALELRPRSIIHVCASPCVPRTTSIEFEDGQGKVTQCIRSSAWELFRRAASSFIDASAAASAASPRCLLSRRLSSSRTAHRFVKSFGIQRASSATASSDIVKHRQAQGA